MRAMALTWLRSLRSPMHCVRSGYVAMRHSLTRKDLDALMTELARCAPRKKSHRVYLVGGGTAVYLGWRESTIDADLYADDESVFRDIQAIKERLDINIEFAQPEQFVPPLAGTADRHVFINTIERVSFYHYDPYSQLLSKVVRGFRRDLADAAALVETGMVDLEQFQGLVAEISPSTYARYPRLSPAAVREAVDAFQREMGEPGSRRS